MQISRGIKQLFLFAYQKKKKSLFFAHLKVYKNYFLLCWAQWCIKNVQCEFQGKIWEAFMENSVIWKGQACKLTQLYKDFITAIEKQTVMKFSTKKHSQVMCFLTLAWVQLLWMSSAVCLRSGIYFTAFLSCIREF